MENNQEYDRILEKIDKKLRDNPDLKKEVEDSIERIEEILEYPIDVNILFMEGVDEYEEEMENYDLDFDINREAMTVKNLISFLSNEEKDYTVSIDPLYLKRGINVIDDILLTTMENNVIIVPKIKKNEE